MADSLNLHVIAGSLCSEKTSRIVMLAARGFQYIPEVRGAIIRYQVAIGGTAVPCANRAAYIRITIPNRVSYEIFQAVAHQGWDGKEEKLCEAVGQAWFGERRSSLLIVPSMVAWVEQNILINPVHPDATGITHYLPEPIWWGERLYG